MESGPLVRVAHFLTFNSRFVHVRSIIPTTLVVGFRVGQIARSKARCKDLRVQFALAENHLIWIGNRFFVSNPRSHRDGRAK